ncbi:MAG: hypothetical protein ACI8RZ_000698 [Myxococcota bacterium]|jgi:hypothetical protein
MDPYALLELEPGASSAEIKKAWKRLARLNHPDLNPNDPGASARFQNIKDAYESLRTGGGQRVGPSQEMDDDWLDTVDWMIEFRRRVVMDELMPRLVGEYGYGVALAWALHHTRDIHAAAEALPPRRTSWRLRRLKLDVILAEVPGVMRLAALERDRRGKIQLTLFASALWLRRGEDEDTLRAEVFATVDNGLAAAVPIALGIHSSPPTLELAREADKRVARNNLIIRTIWAAGAVLMVMMGWIMATS